MKLFKIYVVILFLLAVDSLYSQDKFFFNRLHQFEHLECQHAIGTIIKDKVFYSHNTDNTTFMNFYNSESDILYVDFTKYGSYIAFNEFKKSAFLEANVVLMGFMNGVPLDAVSVLEARMKFRVDKVKDTMVEGKKLKHIKIQPRNTKKHNFKSYNIFINTKAETEIPLYTSPSLYFLLEGSLKDLRGTVVETYFIDLEGYRYCHDILTGFQIINKRVILR
ncbi:hypothetical protein [Psychroflexus sp. MES1-P1E]|uniref:hypothetical protein n=1 Tax=Psychroflexus sp. MES1-P1E TaxID=2058320 RepID=UPI000C7A61DD|nr:hypothetical protein [Psychroflexus sp. MES1-P1E]PKG42481.1 hypothetical protein CXF67_10165 [Psychroflexus sp. MES1-P1E]